MGNLSTFFGTIFNNRKMKSLYRHIKRNIWYYIFLIPGLTYFIIFHYLPMYGVKIAFQDYNVANGFGDSPWVGLKHFRFIFSSSMFYRVLRNTIIISVYRLFFGFPFPIIVSLLLNEVRHVRFKRTIQSIIYVPHFISWAVIGGIAYAILSPQYGVVSVLFKAFDLTPVNLLASPKYFRTVLVASGIWKEFGWGTIIYCAALSSIDPNLYEAASIDGAGRFKQMWHITLAGIRSTIVILLILSVGTLINAGFVQIMSMYNPMVYEVAEIIDTYTYKVGIAEGRFSYTTAVGLFKSVVSFLLVVTSNSLAKKFSEETLW